MILFNSSKDRSTISYARYLMSVHLKRLLNKDEHVDHINNDKLDDRIENLQILTPEMNNLKMRLYNGIKRAKVKLRCPICKIDFWRNKNRTQLNNCKKGQITFCCKKCSSIFNSHRYKYSLDRELLDLISEEQVLGQ